MTTSAEQYGVVGDDTDVELSPRQLLRELRTFANNNSGFRRGQLDALEISAEEGERVEDAENPLDHVQQKYGFAATRVRLPALEQRPITAYVLTLTSTLGNIALPAHIALEAYGVHPDEVDCGTGYSLQRRMTLTISTSERYVQSCESYSYLDADDDVLTYNCTCEGAVNGGAYDDAEEEFPEAIRVQTAEEAAALWTDLDDLVYDDADHAAAEDRDLEMAFTVFYGLQAALARQLGVR
ncbi:MAG TPA: hypothetical protein VFL85_03645 [Candidatus Saccharimonadales bacterium]|nr:hypothetical protein [Candidatus Saccharimonadales bacterium]